MKILSLKEDHAMLKPDLICKFLGLVIAEKK